MHSLICTGGTTDVHIAIRILWAFDNDYLDLYGNYQGVGVNSPSFLSNGINGYGTCLYLNRSQFQSVTVYTPPFLNMAFTSFSLVAWVNAASFTNANLQDNATFGQFDQNVLDRSLHIIVRNQLIYLGFYGDDIQGTRVLQPGVWYHVCIIRVFLVRFCRDMPIGARKALLSSTCTLSIPFNVKRKDTTWVDE